MKVPVLALAVLVFSAMLAASEARPQQGGDVPPESTQSYSERILQHGKDILDNIRQSSVVQSGQSLVSEVLGRMPDFFRSIQEKLSGTLQGSEGELNK